MQTFAGRFYRIVMSGPNIGGDKGASLAGPVAARYSAEIVSVDASGPNDAAAVVRWKGDNGTINPGDKVPVSIPGMPFMIQQGDAVVAAVYDVTMTSAGSASAGLAVSGELLAAGAILVTVIYLVKRIRRNIPATRR